MDFIQISLEDMEGEAAEAVRDVFDRYGYGGAVVETTPPDFARLTLRTVIPAEDDHILQKIEIALALIGQALPQGLPKAQLKLIGANDWAESWKEDFQVVHIGPRLVIQPSWREYTPAPGEIVIRLDPGLAFGSGLHPTTRLCLEILQSMPLKGVAMFDVGTGSGILSIAAAKMGADPVRAVDVDDVAVRVARENFKLNDLPHLQVTVGSAEANEGRQWSLVVANILSNILIELMSDLKVALATEGRLLLAGILNEQEQVILDCLAEHRLHLQNRRTDGDWIAFVVSKHPPKGKRVR
jgi:ribosomal protein L11 methyltransferase